MVEAIVTLALEEEGYVMPQPFFAFLVDPFADPFPFLTRSTPL